MPGWQEFVIDPLSAALTGLADSVGGFGIAIVLMTLAIRVLIFPLSVRGIRAQRRIQVLQPKVNEVKRRARGDRQKESQLTMALYREHGVSPMSGCLPLLLQMPVLLAMYGALLTVGTCIGADGIRIDQGVMGLGADSYSNCAAAGGSVPLDEDFLWFNLAQIDRTIEFLFLPEWWPTPLTYISVLAILGGLTFWLQTYMAQPVQEPTGSAGDFSARDADLPAVLRVHRMVFLLRHPALLGAGRIHPDRPTVLHIRTRQIRTLALRRSTGAGQAAGSRIFRQTRVATPARERSAAAGEG